MLSAALLVLPCISRAEELLENQAGITLGWSGGGFVTPGEVVLISAGITGIARTGAPRGIGGKLKRRQTGLVTDLLRSNLIHGDAVADIGTGGFAGLATGQEGRVRPCVVSGAVSVVVGLVMIEMPQNRVVVSQAAERIERLRDVFVALWEPMLHVHAVGYVNEGHSQWRGGGGDLGGRGGAYTLQAWKGQRGGQAF